MASASRLLLTLFAAAALTGCGDGDGRAGADDDLAAELESLTARTTELEARVADLEARAGVAAEPRDAAPRGLVDDLHGELQRGVAAAGADASVLRCEAHLRQLAALYLTDLMERPGRPKHTGPALFLDYRRKGWITTGSEEVFLCDRDPLALHPGAEVESAAWDTLDLAAPPRGYCSYAVRDVWKHPFGACERLALACCPHHPEGAVVAYEDGSVDLVTRERLGVQEGEAITVGPDSRAELLRPLVYRSE